jgi:hypothetical protein
MSDCIDTFEHNYDEWEIHKIADNSYSYQHYPDCTMGADIQYAITITFEDGRYKFDAQEYFEIYGSGGWHRWTDWKDELKDIILKDAMERINHGT